VASIDAGSVDWLLIACLRLAVVIHRARDARGVPPLTLRREGRGFSLTAAPGWLQRLPLTAAALEEEQRQWQGVGRALYIRALSLRSTAA
jgi:exopolyphosphatase/guanosine-5'-triphosphate,3'-diphosphate pyrophosphatase